jgi:hypothetical protein
MIIYEGYYSREIVEDAFGVGKLVALNPRVKWAIDNSIPCRIDWWKAAASNGIEAKVDAEMTPTQQTEYLLRFT